MKQKVIGVARWVVLFASFPLSGLAVFTAVGPVTSPGLALLGGLLVGVAVGAAESWALGRDLARWTLASGIGLAVGAMLATFVPWPLVGAGIAGLVMAAAQLLASPPLRAWAWLVLGTAGWIVGWAVSLFLAINTEQGFVVFGSTGAIAFVLLVFGITRIPALRRPTAVAA